MTGTQCTLLHINGSEVGKVGNYCFMADQANGELNGA